MSKQGWTYWNNASADQLLGDAAQALAGNRTGEAAACLESGFARATEHGATNAQGAVIATFNTALQLAGTVSRQGGHLSDAYKIIRSCEVKFTDYGHKDKAKKAMDKIGRLIDSSAPRGVTLQSYDISNLKIETTKNAPAAERAASPMTEAEMKSLRAEKPFVAPPSNDAIRAASEDAEFSAKTPKQRGFGVLPLWAIKND